MMFCSPAPILSVSIHAPWEGCDRIILQILLQTHMFQFTHPRKGATFHGRSKNALRRFQFTHPGKGATALLALVNLGFRVSIHAPWEGCDRDAWAVVEATEEVSIHVPWEGCDSMGRVFFFSPRRFQFTHPGKGATDHHYHSCAFFVSFNSRTLGRVRQKTEVRNDTRRSVSIHAPWEGCDCQYFLGASPAFSFNSRTLGRVRQVAGACARLGV